MDNDNTDAFVQLPNQNISMMINNMN